MSTGRAELVRRGHTVSVIASHCPDCTENSDDQGVKVCRPRFKGTLHWYLSRIPGLRTFALAVRSLEYSTHLDAHIRKIHQQDPIDLIEFTEGGSFWHSWRSPIPTFRTFMDRVTPSLKMSGKPVGKSDWYERRISLSAIRRADWVVSPSRSMLDIVQAEADDIPSYQRDPLPAGSTAINPNVRMIADRENQQERTFSSRPE